MTPKHRVKPRFTLSIRALSVVVTFIVTSTVFASNEPQPLGADGSLSMPAMTLPPSDFVSPAFKQAYATYVAMIKSLPKPPAMNAPKKEWDEFDNAYERVLGGLLASTLHHYPVDVADTTFASVHVGIITPRGGVSAQNRNRVLIHLHGGGLGRGGLVKAQIEAVPLAALAQIKIITLDYRQAPYFKFPAASEDVEAVYRKLLEQLQPTAIGLFGCSAGGALAAQAVAWFQAKGLSSPGAVGIFCGAPVPFGKHGDSSIWSPAGLAVDPASFATGPGPSKPGAGYLEGVDINDPKAFPGSSDAVLAKFPATLLLSGTRSPDLSASVAAHAKFLKLGVDASLYVVEGGWHGAPFNSEATPEGVAAVNFIGHWFDQHLSR